MPTRIAPIPSGVTVHSVAVGLGGVAGDPSESANVVLESSRAVSDATGRRVSGEQLAVAVRKAASIDRVRTERSVEVESAWDRDSHARQKSPRTDICTAREDI